MTAAGGLSRVRTPKVCPDGSGTVNLNSQVHRNGGAAGVDRRMSVVSVAQALDACAAVVWSLETHACALCACQNLPGNGAGLSVWS